MCSSARRIDALAHLLVGDAFFLGPILHRQVEREHLAQRLVEAGDVPLLGIGILRDVLGDQILDHRMAHAGDGLVDRLVAHQLEPLLEDDRALVVHHVVVFEQVLADVEVARLDLLLRLFQRLVDPRMDDRLVFLQAQLLQHAVELVGAEDAHEIVFQRQEELGMAGVALAAGAAAQLVVDAAALVPLGAEHEQAAGLQRLFLQARHLLADLVGARILVARRPIGRCR